VNLIGQEHPLKPPFPDMPHWSENFCLAVFDPGCGVGLWLHLGRWRKDINLWRETVVVNWPDGTVSAQRGFGNGLTCADGPGGPNFAVRVLEPGRRFSYSYLGGVRRLPSATLREGLQGDGPRQRLAFSLDFESSAEIWDMHKEASTQEFLGTGHIEQPGRVSGTIEIGDERFVFNGMGNRDHSMGPRNTPTLESHQWLQGYFDNGKKFMLYDAMLRGQSTPVFSSAVVYEGETLFDATVTYPWRIADAGQAQKDFGFSLHYAHGVLDIRTERIGSPAFLSFTAPNDIYVGVYPSGNPPLTLLEQSTHYRLNGDISGFGRLERTVPGVIGHD
jgi:hypothetical protein